MKHEELLAKIKDFEADNELDASVSMYALRAVVELHKPTDYLEDEVFKCTGCGIDGEWSVWNEEYPCPTIQAIEKELVSL